MYHVYHKEHLAGGITVNRHHGRFKDREDAFHCARARQAEGYPVRVWDSAIVGEVPASDWERRCPA